MSNVYEIQRSKVKLDIGGHNFTTSLDTLSRDPDSMLATMFSGRHDLSQSEDGSYFIDRDGTHFRYVLNYLRGGITLPNDLPEDKSLLHELFQEADFYQLKGLCELIKEVLRASDASGDYTQDEITEMMSKLGPFSNLSDDIVAIENDPRDQIPSSTPLSLITQLMTKTDLDFTNKTLNGLSFAYTTFFHDVSFRSANLVGSSFYGCEFGAGVKVDFSYADLTNCDFRQCKGKRFGSEPNSLRGGGGGLVSGSSSEVFLRLVTNKNIEFRHAKLRGAIFDPQVYRYLINEMTIT